MFTKYNSVSTLRLAFTHPHSRPVKIFVELDIDVLARSRCLNLTYISQPTLHYTNKFISVSTYAWIHTLIYMCIRSAGTFLQLQKCIRQQNRFVVRTVSLRQACRPNLNRNFISSVCTDERSTLTTTMRIPLITLVFNLNRILNTIKPSQLSLWRLLFSCAKMSQEHLCAPSMTHVFRGLLQAAIKFSEITSIDPLRYI